EERHERMKAFCRTLAGAWSDFDRRGHAMEIGHAFLEERLPALLEAHNAGLPPERHMPWLAALICCSAFDIALHDAYGVAAGRPVYETYGPPYMNRDLAWFLPETSRKDLSFAGKYPRDYFASP